jgi:predicted secreted protein
MSVTSAIAIYFIIWWIVLFAVLPWGMRTQEEAGEVVPGTVASAPARMRFLRIIITTSLVAAIVFGAFYALLHSGLTLDDVPFVRDL